jgi:HD-GYP domain-containing protein (c-di-GMP phosphodiesterase class II)
MYENDSFLLGSASIPSERREFLNFMLAQEHQNILTSAMLADIWEKSFETREHGERIAESAFSIGKRMMLSNGQLHNLILLAKVHDLGKTLLPAKLLNKTCSLDDQDWDQIKMHPVFGARIARLTTPIRHLANDILAHHERWDGQGYPQGLSGVSIPFLARIINIADSFENLTHDRYFRKAVRIDDALIEMRMNAGKQFDPMILDIFIGTFGKSLPVSV